jgi:hypothetical protein
LKDGALWVQEGVLARTIGAADGSNPRIDRIVLRLTREGETEQGKIALAVLAGTAAASPVAPTLTQSSALWEVSLAQVLVGTGVTTIASNKVTDERTFAFFGTAANTFAEGDHTHSFTVSEGGVALDTDISTLDFDASDFVLTESPENEVNIGLAYGTSAGTPAEGNHAHAADYQPLDADLTAVAGLAISGFVARTGSGTAAARTLTGTSNQISVGNGDGVSGNPTFELSTDIIISDGTATLKVQSNTDDALLVETTGGTDIFSVSGSTGRVKVSNSFELIATGDIRLASESGPLIKSGSGSPEGVVTAVIGSMYLRTDGGASTTLYIKTSGSGSTGWTAK